MPVPPPPPAIELPLLAAEFGETSEPKTAAISLAVRRPRCTPAASGEIVVCAHDPKQDRLQSLPPEPAIGMPPARTRLGAGVTADIHNEQGSVGGWPSNRIMLGLKFDF